MVRYFRSAENRLPANQAEYSKKKHTQLNGRNNAKPLIII